MRVRPLRPTVVAVLALVAMLACATRDRPFFPLGSGPDAIGPSTSIDEPTQDTTVVAGPAVFINGRTLDDDGIDTLYVVIDGGVTAFAPIVRPASPYRFGLPITTNNLSGEVITVRVFGTDRLGNRGDTATRQITVQ